MLDIEIITAPTDEATDVVSVVEIGRHMQLSPRLRVNSDWNARLTDAITDAVDKLGGIGGELNRTILRTTYRRYMDRFPGLDECGKPKPILLPYPPLVTLHAVTIEDGSSPENNLDTADYVVKSGMLVPEIHPVDSWPDVTPAPRAVSVTYTAGYTADAFPAKLKRMVKFLSAHYLENTEATVADQNKTQVDRKVLFAMDDLRAALRISVSYDDWNE